MTIEPYRFYPLKSVVSSLTYPIKVGILEASLQV